MWFLNFCSPFIFTEKNELFTGRIIMYSEVFLLFLVYILFLLLFKLLGSTVQIPYAKVRKEAIQLPGILDRDQGWLYSSFKQWYTHYFGLHAVIIGACILYSPYLPQWIITIIHFIFFILAVILRNLKIENGKVTKILYNICQTIANLCNIILLFSATMGVGASSYDQLMQICYLQRNS